MSPMSDEDKIRLAKSRGGRGTMVEKDKTKYDRKKNKKDTKGEVEKWKTEQGNQ